MRKLNADQQALAKAKKASDQGKPKKVEFYMKAAKRADERLDKIVDQLAEL